MRGWKKEEKNHRQGGHCQEHWAYRKENPLVSDSRKGEV